MPLLRTGAGAYAAMTAPLPAAIGPRTTGRTGHSGGVDRIVVGTLACAAAAAAVVAGGDLDGHRGRLAALVLPSWVVFGLCLVWALAAQRRLARPVLTVVLAAAVVQVPGLLAPPRTSTDAYRYVWDGRVQLAGVSPYRYAPLDDRLAPLRDPLLFPGLGPAQRSGYRTTALPPTVRGCCGSAATTAGCASTGPGCRRSTPRWRRRGSPRSPRSPPGRSAPPACSWPARCSPCSSPRCSPGCCSTAGGTPASPSSGRGHRRWPWRPRAARTSTSSRRRWSCSRSAPPAP